MKPLKRFFLYCFYCTIAYFTKGHPAHGAYKTPFTISRADDTGNHYYDVYISDNTECKGFSINGEISDFVANVCNTGIGIRNIVFSKVVLCTGVTKEDDGTCTLTNCSWNCELSCPAESWGKTILETEINDFCPSADEAGPACPENKTYSSTEGWCNECPTTWSDDGEHSAGTCSGGDSFVCNNSPSL